MDVMEYYSGYFHVELKILKLADNSVFNNRESAIVSNGCKIISRLNVALNGKDALN